MSGTTGPILAGAGIVVFNAVIVQSKSPVSQTRVVVGALIAAGGLSLMEKALPQAATALAWLSLVAVLVVRVDPTTPSPIESFQQWLNAK